MPLFAKYFQQKKVCLMFFFILFFHFSALEVFSKGENCTNQCITIITKKQLFIRIVYYKIIHLLTKFAEIYNKSSF